MSGFVLIAALLTITPGADMALVTKTALAGGRRGAFATILGICLGCAVHALASSFGLSIVLRSSPQAFAVVRALGAGYLMWLGAQALRDAFFASAAAHAAPPLPPRGSGHAFADGFLTNLPNPK